MYIFFYPTTVITVYISTTLLIVKIICYGNNYNVPIIIYIPKDT